MSTGIERALLQEESQNPGNQPLICHLTTMKLLSFPFHKMSTLCDPGSDDTFIMSKLDQIQYYVKVPGIIKAVQLYYIAIKYPILCSFKEGNCFRKNYHLNTQIF